MRFSLNWIPWVLQLRLPSSPEATSLLFQTSLPEDLISNRLFASVNAWLRSWPTAYALNGRAAVPATVPRGTLLYHVRPSGPVPTGQDWFAFDAEHSALFGFGNA